MNGSIYTYSLIKALYDNGKDFIDSFWPIVLRAMSTNPNIPLGLPEIQKKISQDFALYIPLHALATILSRARKLGYVTPARINPALHQISEQGLTFVGALEAVRDVERRVNYFITDIKEFFLANGTETTAVQIKKDLNSFIGSNVQTFIEFVSPAQEQTLPTFQPSVEHEKLLVEYLKMIQKAKPAEYKVLCEIVHGSIISATLSATGHPDLASIGTRRFSRLVVYLDTNFLFSLLEYHTSEINTAAQELVSLLNQHGIKIKVFDFTLAEACSVIHHYPERSKEYPSFVRVDSIYSNLKMKGWALSDVQNFIMNTEKIVIEKGVEIEAAPDIELRSYEPKDPSLRGSMAAYKVQQRASGANHDLAAIEKIKKMRKGRTKFIEDSGAFFLTSDIALYQFNLLGMGHKEEGTVGEIVLDRLLAIILWLKNPSLTIPLTTIIANHSRSLLIDQQVWEKFYKVLMQVKREGKATDEQIATLFYHNQIENVLSSLDSKQISEVDTSFVMAQIEASKHRNDESFATKQEEIKSLLSQKSEAEGLASEYFGKISGIKKAIKNGSAKLARFLAWAIALVLFFLISAFLIWGGVELYEQLDGNRALLFSLGFVGGGSLLILLINKLTILRTWIFNYLTNKIYTFRTSRFHLRDD